MRKFALMASLLATVCLTGSVAHSQGMWKLIKTVTAEGKPAFTIVFGGVVLGVCYGFDCASEVQRLAKTLGEAETPTEAELKASSDLDE